MREVESGRSNSRGLYLLRYIDRMLDNVATEFNHRDSLVNFS